MQEKCSRTPILKILSTAVLFYGCSDSKTAQEKKLSVDVKGDVVRCCRMVLAKKLRRIIYYENDDIGK